MAVSYRENAAEYCDEEYDAWDIQLPEERCPETLTTVDLIWGLVVV